MLKFLVPVALIIHASFHSFVCAEDSYWAPVSSCCSLQGLNLRYSLAHLGLKLCCLLRIDPSVSLSGLLYCILVLRFLVVFWSPLPFFQFEVLYMS